MSLVMVLVVFLLIAFVLGFVGRIAPSPHWGWSPVGFMLLLLLVLVLTGNLRIG